MGGTAPFYSFFSDGLSGTLRAAIIATNHGTNTLPISLGIGTYTLSLTSGAQNEQYGDLNITSNITIRGMGAEQTTIDAQSTDRLFHIMPGVTVTLENMRLEGGDATQGGSNGKGGALFVEGGTLLLNNVAVVHNTATFGGGLAIEGGTLSTDNHTSFNFNQATTDGGGIYSALDFDNSGIASNVAGNNGGGVALSASTAHFMDASNISFNLSHLAGGGIFSNNSTITIEDATLVVGSQVVNDPFAPFGASPLTPNGIGGGAAINGSTVNMDASSLSATDTHQSSFGFNQADEGTGIFANHNNWSWDGISTFNSVAGPGIGPVVLSFGDNQIDLISPENSHVYVQSEKGSYQMGWVGSDEGVLVYNPTHQDTLTSLTQIAFTWYLPGARTDLQGLAAFDSNHDAQLSNADLHFQDFNVWFKGNLFSLDQLSITSISLNSTGQSQTASGNVIHGLTTYQTSDGQSHAAADVTLSIHDVLPASSPLPTSPSLILTAPTVSDPLPPHETPHPAFG